MADVVDLGERRRARDARTPAAVDRDDSGPLVCHCGSEWWDVAVTIEAGVVTDRSTDVVCHSCGQRHSVSWGGGA